MKLNAEMIDKITSEGAKGKEKKKKEYKCRFCDLTFPTWQD